MEYKEFWEKVNGINDNFKNYVDEKFLSFVGDNYEEYSGDSLFGLDFILDIEKGKYYLIDANGLPGYKELYDDMGEILVNHITMGINKINKK